MPPFTTNEKYSQNVPKCVTTDKLKVNFFQVKLLISKFVTIRKTSSTSSAPLCPVLDPMVASKWLCLAQETWWPPPALAGSGSWSRWSTSWPSSSSSPPTIFLTTDSSPPPWLPGSSLIILKLLTWTDWRYSSRYNDVFFQLLNFPRTFRDQLTPVPWGWMFAIYINWFVLSKALSDLKPNVLGFFRRI